MSSFEQPSPQQPSPQQPQQQPLQTSTEISTVDKTTAPFPSEGFTRRIAEDQIKKFCSSLNNTNLSIVEITTKYTFSQMNKLWIPKNFSEQLRDELNSPANINFASAGLITDEIISVISFFTFVDALVQDNMDELEKIVPHLMAVISAQEEVHKQTYNFFSTLIVGLLEKKRDFDEESFARIPPVGYKVFPNFEKFMGKVQTLIEEFSTDKLFRQVMLNFVLEGMVFVKMFNFIALRVPIRSILTYNRLIFSDECTHASMAFDLLKLFSERGERSGGEELSGGDGLKEFKDFLCEKIAPEVVRFWGFIFQSREEERDREMLNNFLRQFFLEDPVPGTSIFTLTAGGVYLSDLFKSQEQAEFLNKFHGKQDSINELYTFFENKTTSYKNKVLLVE